VKTIDLAGGYSRRIASTTRRNCSLSSTGSRRSENKKTIRKLRSQKNVSGICRETIEQTGKVRPLGLEKVRPTRNRVAELLAKGPDSSKKEDRICSNAAESHISRRRPSMGCGSSNGPGECVTISR
jgi:hypothetical protein